MRGLPCILSLFHNEFNKFNNTGARILDSNYHMTCFISCFIEFIKQVEERDKMRGLPCILSLFHNEFNKFNNTGARILDSNYHMTLKLL